jgi:hypothetical protein
MSAVEFNGVIAGFLAAPRCLGIFFDQFLNLGHRQLTRSLPNEGILDCGWCHGPLADEGTVGFSPGMINLDRDFDPVPGGLNSLDQFPVLSHHLIRPDAGDTLEPRPLRIDDVVLTDNQDPSRPGPFLHNSGCTFP